MPRGGAPYQNGDDHAVLKHELAEVVDLHCTSRQEHFRALLFNANLNLMLEGISNDQANRPDRRRHNNFLSLLKNCICCAIEIRTNCELIRSLFV